MQLKLRGFTKETLKKYDDVINHPLLAISPKNQKELKVVPGDIQIAGIGVNLIDGKSDEFFGMTKNLRESLGVDIGDEITIENSDGGLIIK